MIEVQNIDVERFSEEIKSKQNAVVLDVRSPEEKDEGDIPGSKLINIMDPEFSKMVDVLDKDKEYYIFCRSGNRSATACKYMQSKGFTKVYNLKGGINEWNRLKA